MIRLFDKMINVLSRKDNPLNRRKKKNMFFFLFFFFFFTYIKCIGVDLVLKVVICGKYLNLNKITKNYHISLKFDRLLIFVILYSVQCKIEGHAFEKVFLIRKDQREFLCAKI